MVSLYSIKIPQQNEFYRKDKTLPGNTPFARRVVNILYLSHKETPRYPYFSGVFTLEAAVVLPLLACFFVSILFFFRVMQIEIAVQKALNDTGRQLAVYMANEESALSVAEAQALFLKELGETEVPECYILGGKLGISLLSSEFDEREVNLKACYRILLPVRIFWIKELSMEQRADCRKWNGWSAVPENGEADVWVYITETGSVYHRVSTCSHLELSIQSVKREEIAYLRNENGGKYHECSSCANQTNTWGNVYITNQGDCYHNDLNCSGIKRTVYMVRLSEVGERECCKRCAALEE